MSLLMDHVAWIKPHHPSRCSCLQLWGHTQQQGDDGLIQAIGSMSGDMNLVHNRIFCPKTIHFQDILQI